MRALLDVNVLIALLDASHAHHERAHGWFGAEQALGWASCPLTENGVVRIMSHPHYSQIIRRTAIEVIADLRSAIERTDHRFWPDDLSFRDGRFFWPERIQGPKQITDIYLLALAVKNGGRLATFDARISLDAVVGATPAHLAVIDSSRE